MASESRAEPYHQKCDYNNNIADRQSPQVSLPVMVQAGRDILTAKLLKLNIKTNKEPQPAANNIRLFARSAPISRKNSCVQAESLETLRSNMTQSDLLAVVKR